MLEASGFDFRSRHPQRLLVKLAKVYGVKEGDKAAQAAYSVTLDLYRTFAPLKQTTATLAFASLELASRLLGTSLDKVEKGEDYEQWQTSRSEVMGSRTKSELVAAYRLTEHYRNLVGSPRAIHPS
jgi:CTD kinase subunit beta